MKLLPLYREALSGLPRSVWLLVSITFIHRSGTMVLPFLILYLTVVHGMTKEDAGLALSLYGVGSMVGNGLGGHAADRMGVVRVQVLALAAAAVSFWTYVQLRGPWTLSAGALVVGTVVETFRPANTVHLTSLCPVPRQRQALALNRLAINLGMSVGAVVGGMLAEIDYGLLFLVNGGTCALAAAGLLLWVPPAAGTASPEPGAPRGASPFRDPVFLAAMVLTGIAAVVFMQAFSTMPVYLQEHMGQDEESIGRLFAINTVLIVLLEMVLVHLLRHRAPLPVMAVGALLIGGGFALLPLGSGQAWAALAIVVFTFGEMLDSPFAMSFVAARAGAGRRGAYLGTYGLAFSVAFVVAPALGTRVYASQGPETLWLGCGVAGAVVALGYLLLARRVGRERADQRSPS